MLKLDVLIGLFLLLGGLGAFFDHVLKEATVVRVRTQIIHWWEQLRDIDTGKVIKGSNSYFVDLFDEIYGKRYFSVKTIVRSCIFSVIGVVIAFIVLSLTLPYYLVYASNVYFEFYQGYLFLFVGNLLADYVSLIETRIILRLASRLRVVSLFPLLIADLFMSLICYGFIAIGFLTFIAVAILENGRDYYFNFRFAIEFVIGGCWGGVSLGLVQQHHFFIQLFLQVCYFICSF